MKLSEIVDKLDATLLTGAEMLDKDISRCGASDLMSDILAALSENSMLLTGLTTVQVIRTATVAGVGAVVFVRGKKPPREVIEMAEAQGLPLISSPYSRPLSTTGRFNLIKRAPSALLLLYRTSHKCGCLRLSASSDFAVVRKPYRLTKTKYTAL